MERNGWWLWPVGLLAFLIAITIFSRGQSQGDELPSCSPCKIIGTIAKPDGTVVEQFKYPFLFPTRELCDKEMAQDYFKSAVDDLQARADNLGHLGPSLQNLKATAACVPIGEQPVHP